MLILGVDGGASTTRAAIADQDGEILGWGTAGPSNHLYGLAGVKRLQDALRDSIGKALARMSGGPPREAGKPVIDSACLGMTGVRDGSQESRIVEECLREIVHCRHVVVCGDTRTALAGASGGRPGILVYAGTGSVGFGIAPSGATAKVGGWGYLIDDEGGAYRIGLAGLKAAYRGLDGRGEPTRLLPMLLAYFGVEEPDAMRRLIYSNDGLDRPTLARLARIVSEAAAMGDAVSQRILRAAAEELAGIGIELARKLRAPDWVPVIHPSGGVFRAGEAVTRPFVEAVRAALPDVRVEPPLFAPIMGALLLAFSAIGADAGLDMVARMVASAGRAGLEVKP